MPPNEKYFIGSMYADFGTQADFLSERRAQAGAAVRDPSGGVPIIAELLRYMELTWFVVSE